MTFKTYITIKMLLEAIVALLFSENITENKVANEYIAQTSRKEPIDAVR